jgi:hypothetical protein
LDRWQVERRLIVRFSGVRDLRQYNDLQQLLGSLPDVTSWREEYFQRQTVAFRLGVAKSAEQIAAHLRQMPYLRSATVTQEDDKHLLITLAAN